MGALISFTVIAYVCQYGMGSAFGGEKWRFVVGYSIPVLAMGKVVSLTGLSNRSIILSATVVCSRRGRRLPQRQLHLQGCGSFR
jgi:hypothetical protein